MLASTSVDHKQINKADLYCGPLIITLFKKANNKYFKTLKYVSIPENFREFFFKKIKYRMVTSLISSSTSLTNKAASISPSVNRIPESLTLCIHAYPNLTQMGWTLFLSSLQALGASPSLVIDFLRHAPRWWLLTLTVVTVLWYISRVYVFIKQWEGVNLNPLLACHPFLH